MSTSVRQINLTQRPKRFEWAARGPLSVRHETFSAGLGMTLLYVSDLHLSGRWTEVVAKQILEAASRLRPDLILLGGDLIDRKGALPLLHTFLKALRKHAGAVLGIPGNHDRYVDESSVRDAVIEHGGHWLPDTAYRHSGLSIEALECRLPAERRDTTFRILCAHDPAEALVGSIAHFDLVLAGHLHGCQCVLWASGGKLYPGGFFYRWNGPRFEIDSTTLLVSQGSNDTVPLRWRCPREIIQCDL